MENPLRAKLETNRKITKTGCWIWTRCAFKNTGYGCIGVSGKTMSVHRVAYQVFVGPIPDGRSVLHRCDVKLCFCPDHLYLGDAKQNAKDAIERGQQPIGDRHWRRLNPHRQRGDAAPHRTLCESDVRKILKAYELGDTQSELAREYAVSVQQIHRIVHRQSWRSIQE